MACINPYPILPGHVAADARLFVDRQSLMLSLPHSRRVAELGVLFGENAAFILTLDPDELHLLDLDFALLEGGSCSLTPPDPRPGAAVMAHPAVSLHKGDGARSLTMRFTADSLDWVYVDGAHDYSSAYRDGKAAMRVAPVVIFNDYTNWSIIEGCEYGVITAVNQLLNENTEWEMFAIALQRDGYHDVAIRRRA